MLDELQGQVFYARSAVLHRQRRDDRLCRLPAPVRRAAEEPGDRCPRARRWRRCRRCKVCSEIRSASSRPADRSRRLPRWRQTISPASTADRQQRRPAAPGQQGQGRQVAISEASELVRVRVKAAPGAEAPAGRRRVQGRAACRRLWPRPCRPGSWKSSGIEVAEHRGQADPGLLRSGAGRARRASSTGSRPLSRSPSRVRAASFGRPRRSMLVAPGLPEPLARGSGLPLRRLSRMAKDSEPSR